MKVSFLTIVVIRHSTRQTFSRFDIQEQLVLTHPVANVVPVSWPKLIVGQHPPRRPAMIPNLDLLFAAITSTLVNASPVTTSSALIEDGELTHLVVTPALKAISVGHCMLTMPVARSFIIHRQISLLNRRFVANKLSSTRLKMLVSLSRRTTLTMGSLPPLSFVITVQA
jgi:hypothetical protein